MADVNSFFDTPDTTAEYEPKDIQDNKIMAVLAYIGLLLLIPLFAAKNSKFARFHVNQGLPLMIVGLAIGIISIPLGLIPIVGIITSIIFGLAGLCVLALAILGIVNASTGKAKKLPLVGKFKILK
ncbi:MAG: DUF4870 domain-containing protein [Clostridia bacterium]|nr:DUF4870 domain-containing protein [Clostridia bacterium]